jgi:hypothetical protein
MHRCFVYLAVFILSILVQGLVANAAGPTDPESIRSWPPDVTPYARPAVPEDAIPLGRGAMPEAIAPRFLDVHIVDVVVSNTNPTLTNTDTFNDGETSIAVNPLNPDEIVITAFSGSWGANAPLWHSLDSGLTWTKRASSIVCSSGE